MTICWTVFIYRKVTNRRADGRTQYWRDKNGIT